MEFFVRCFVVQTLTILALCGVPVLAAELDNGAALFTETIRPVLQTKCIRCHNSEKHKGELDLTNVDAALKGGKTGPVLIPGKSADSRIIKLLKAGEMPPNEPLPQDLLQAFHDWIDAGATYANVKLTPPVEKRADHDWWSLRKLSDAPPPQPQSIPKDWVDSPIDRFIFAKLAEKNLAPNPPADRRTLIRRATYDLTGLPPTPDEVAAFINDPRPDAYDRLIDRLLASPQYGQHWGRHWLDVIRFGESTGFERNVIIDNAWPFRDYVICSFNEDKPFDQFVLEHLAGDVVAKGDPQVEVATAFLVCGPYDNVGNQDPVQAAQIRANTIDDMIRATGETFLGLTIGCGRCHDHKFDPITQKDYYRLYAAFAGVNHGARTMAAPEQKQARAAALQPLEEKRNQLNKQRDELLNAIFAQAEKNAATHEAEWTRPPVDRTSTEEVFPPTQARYVRLTAHGVDTNPDARTGYKIDEFEIWTAGDAPRNVALASSGAKAEGSSRVAADFADAYSAKLAIDGRFGAQWIAQSPTLTISLPKLETIHRVLFSSDRPGAAGDQGIAAFVCEYDLEASLDAETWTRLADSRDRKPVSPAHRRKRLMDFEYTPDLHRQIAAFDAEIGEINRQIAAVPSLPTAWAGNFHQLNDPIHVFLGGSPQNKGPQVLPASLSVLAEVTKPYELPADAPEPNRRLSLAKWLVAPENPLTPRVLANRLWHYHFGTGIVNTPSDFGYMGGKPSHPELLDWLARQVHVNGWRLKPLHKWIMRSQAYRQASTDRENAANIDADSRYLWRFPPRRLAGEEIRDTILAITDKLDPTMGGPGFRLYRYLEDNVATYVPLETHGPETYRRAVYHQNARAARVDLMTDFDCPDNAFGAPRRAATTTPLQALTMMNHSFTLDMANHFAERIQRDAVSDIPADQAKHAFSLAFARAPTESELTAAAALIQSHGLKAFCRAMLNANELIYLN
jgi:cytochrome c553